MKKPFNFHDLLERILPGFGEILFIALFFAVLGFGPQLMNVDGDLGRHITLGNYIIDHKNIPTKDVFSFTKLGDPLTPHEWLAEVIFAGAHHLAGLNGVVWITAVILAGAYWLVYEQGKNLSNMPLIALFGSLLAAAASSLHWLTRPHIFTILLSCIWASELEKLRLGIRKNWLVFPILMLLWVNLHGAFLVGIAIWITYLVGVILERNDPREYQSFIWVGISSIVISLVNPDGLGLWKTGIGFLGNRYLVSHTAEYLPPDFQQPSTWPFLIFIMLSLSILALGKRKFPYSHILLVAGFTVMGLISARNIPLYAVVVTPLLTRGFAYIIGEKQTSAGTSTLFSFQGKIAKIENAIKGGFLSILSVLMAGLLLINGIKLDSHQQGNQFLPEIFPVEAVDFMIDDLPEGYGFNYFPWGGYLLYRLWPEKLVFIDGQTDFYGENLTRQYEQVVTMSPGWEKVFQEYDVDWLIMPADSLLVTRLRKAEEWEILYQDDIAVVLLFNERIMESTGAGK
jgi:hypothetical protein